MSRAALTAEERALADKLARIAPRGEPSAALDAKILAMAAEAHAQATTAPAKPRRWLPPLALAASLALVAGVIWRVHPVLNPQDTPSPAAISEADAAAALPSMPGTEVMTEAPAELADAAAMPETHAASAAIEMAPPPARKAAPVAMSAPVAEEPLQLPPMALPASAPPLEQAQRAGQKVQESHSAKSTAAMSGRVVARNAELAAPPPPPPAPPAPVAMMERAAPVAADTSESLDSITLTGTRILPGEMEIARIRALIEQGHTRKARRELKKLMRRHPDIEIPDDLKQLQD
ncbi:hypothetical protein CO615_09720 [Lysobacteraceae bacterium NML75-0749]|nr:hypothetical protein CO615_09720 [Xanthomonadaceae bacterium NML75-0749]PJK04705.1 hypothetical protein CO612_06380 [Xanthomonadaceae bacterium NML71-0210]PJK05455.1 hypothetical protein CO609_00330 [Xanthomonadaceae bacterium NML91-0268]